MDDASVRGAVVQIDALLEADGVVFVLAGRGWMDQFRLTGVLPSCAGAAMKDSAGNEHFHGSRQDLFTESELPRNQLPEITLK
jgi:hypothetical protein